MSFNLFVGGLGGPELVIVFMLVVLLFGASKLPKLARASGEAMGEFQRGRENLENDIRDATSTESTADEPVDADATVDGATADDDADVVDSDAIDGDRERDVDTDATSA